MSNSLQEMSIFSRIVVAGSLSAAAKDLGLSPAVISRALASLEARLGVRLINRTTRRLRLTDEGASYFDACTRILAELEEANAAVSANSDEPQGTLRVALPASFGHQYIVPLIPVFGERYPKIRLALSLSDREINFLEEGFDLAVRIAELEDSSLAARKLAPNRRVICASPEYIKRHGQPTRPEEFVAHNWILTGFSQTLEYHDPGGRPGTVRVTGRYACDNWSVLREWALAGLGIALKSTWDVRKQLEDGSLVALCSDYTFGNDIGIYAVYPHRRHLPAKVRAFVDFLAASFGPEPEWDSGVKSPKPRIKGRAGT
jgi:DNA-binding transcriptional LysR family regulator